MKWPLFWLLFCPGILIPLSAAHAAVVINEIAWMGSSVSASDEWIELANRGDAAVDLSGWTLSWGAVTIKLGGSIEGNGYYLIERTDDASVPGMKADLIASFGRGLANTGSVTLVMKNAAGSVVDQIESGPGWTKLGGDKMAKHTPQRQHDGTWITGYSTPRALNVSESAAAPVKSASRTKASQEKAPKPERVSFKKSKAHQVATRIAAPTLAEEALSDTSVWVWLGLAVMLVVAGTIGFLMVYDRKKRTEADEYEIIEGGH